MHQRTTVRKTYTGTKWAFSESVNTNNPASHCDIAWAAALATHAHTERRCEVGAAVAYEHGWFDGKVFHFYGTNQTVSPETAMLWSDDPAIWMPFSY